jgi:hypothetical protein
MAAAGKILDCVGLVYHQVGFARRPWQCLRMSAMTAREVGKGRGDAWTMSKTGLLACVCFVCV